MKLVVTSQPKTQAPQTWTEPENRSGLKLVVTSPPVVRAEERPKPVSVKTDTAAKPAAKAEPAAGRPDAAPSKLGREALEARGGIRAANLKKQTADTGANAARPAAAKAKAADGRNLARPEEGKAKPAAEAITALPQAARTTPRKKGAAAPSAAQREPASPSRLGQEAQAALRGTNPALNRSRVDSRAGQTLSGAAKTYAAGMTGAAGFGLELLNQLNLMGERSSPSYQRAQQEEKNIQHYQEMLERGALDDGTPIDAQWRQRLESYLRSARRYVDSEAERMEQIASDSDLMQLAGRVNRKAMDLQASGQRDISRAKEGLGFLGQLAVDTGVAGAQMLADYTPALLTGGAGALGPMVVRAAGGGALTGLESGKGLGTRAAYAVGSGTLAGLTEQISNVPGVLKAAYGEGMAEKIFAKLAAKYGQSGAVKLAQRLSGSAAGRVALAAFGEGFEEFAEDFGQAFLKEATIHPTDTGGNYIQRSLRQFDPAEAGYEFLIGGILGGMGGVGDVLTGRTAQLREVREEQEALQNLTRLARDAVQAQQAQAQADLEEEAMREGAEDYGRRVVERLAVEGEWPAQGGRPHRDAAPQGPGPSEAEATVGPAALGGPSPKLQTQAGPSPNLQAQGRESTQAQASAQAREGGRQIAAPAADSGSFSIGGAELERMLQARRQGQESPEAPAQAETRQPTPIDLEFFLPRGKRISTDVLTAEQQAAADAANEQGRVDMDAAQRLYRVNPEEHIDRRTAETVGSRKVNAFQFDHPQLRPYYRQAAEILSRELDAYIPGGETAGGVSADGNPYSYRLSRTATERIGRLIDDYGVRPSELGKVLEGILQDHGQENFAAAKRVELLLDEMLSNGFQDPFTGEVYGPNEGYLQAKGQIAGAVETQESGGYLDGVDELEGAGAQGPEIVKPGTDGLGAADAGSVNTDFDRLQAQADQFHDEGPDPARPTAVPRRDFDGRPISQTASTVYGAKAVPDDVIPMIEQMIASGKLSYDVITDGAAMDRARANIRAKGFQGAMEEYRGAVENHKVTKDLTALGETLLNNAANARDGAALAELLMLYQASGTEAAQALQARSIFRRLSPESQLYAIQKSVEQINQRTRARNGKRGGLTGGHADSAAGTLQRAAEQAARKLETMTAAYENVVDTMRGAYEQAEQERLGKDDAGWVERLGRDLARNAANRAGRGSRQATVYETMLKDLTALMSEHVGTGRRTGPKRTAADILADLFANRAEYARAWEQAKAELAERYKGNPEALDALEGFLNGTMGYNGAGPDTTMLRAVAEAALENDVTLKDTVLKGQYDRSALVNQIADTLIQKTGAKGSNQTVVRDAVERWVQNRIDGSGKSAGDYLRRDIKTALKEIGADMSEIIRSGRGDRAVVEGVLTRMLTEEYGVSREAAAEIARDVTEQFRDMVREASQAELNRMLRQMPKKARKTLSQRMEELINLGAFSSGEYNHRQAVRRLFGVEDEITIPQELIQKFLDAENEEAREKVRQEILQAAADQMPGSWRGIFDTVRYLAMLGNVRTHARNVLGNAAFQLPAALKNRVGAAVEMGYNLLAGEYDQVERTKSLAGANPFGQLAREARADWEGVKDSIRGGKFEEAKDGSIRDLASPFKNVGRFQKAADFLGNTLGKAADINSALLAEEDNVFKKFIYAQSLAGYLQANGVRSIRDAGPDLLARARNYAAQEAFRNTFNDRNAVSDLATQIGRLRQSEKPEEQFLSVIAEGILPFKRTPANVAVRGVEYSPLGALVEALNVAWNGTGTTADVSKRLDRLSASISGSALLGLGVLAAGAGLVSGREDEDPDQRQFDKLQGKQAYAAHLPGGYSYTLDWASPASIPFFIGVELYKSLEDGTLSAEDLASLLRNTTDPLLSMSMLQGVNDILTAASNAEEWGDNQLAAAVAQAATGYFTQIVPTIGGQLERTAEDRRMTTYAGKDSPLPKNWQDTLGKLSAKTPGWDYRQIPYLDEWGRTEDSGSLGARAAENFFSPGYVSKTRTNAVEEELQRLADSTGSTAVFPDRAGKSIQVDGNTREDLTAEEWQTYATLKGQTSLETLDSLMGSPGYKRLDDEARAEAVSLAYTYADSLAKERVSDWKPGKSGILTRIRRSPLPPAAYILYSVSKEDLDGNGSISQAEAAQALIGLPDVSNEQKGQAWAAEYPDSKPAKNPFTGALAQQGYRPEEALAFWSIYNRSGTREDPYTQAEKKQDIAGELDLTAAEVNRLWNLMKRAAEG